MCYIEPQSVMNDRERIANHDFEITRTENGDYNTNDSRDNIVGLQVNCKRIGENFTFFTNKNIIRIFYS